ncbi:MAG: CoA activase [Deltaproteobacteria bacterium]|nr:CoA activase [Deltaproteobacteria bacterium]
MITAGIDAGSKTIKAVVVKDGRIIGQAKGDAGYDVKPSAEAVWQEALKAAGIKASDISKVVATGAGRDEAPYVQAKITEVSAAAKGAVALNPAIRTVIDVGAEEGRAIKINADGKVVDFAINEKCAAGSGAFIESMARALEVTLEELGPLSLQSTKMVNMNAQCAVFAESELVTLVHAKTAKPDMARAIHNAISDRITSLVRRVGLETPVMLIGGLAKNIGFYTSLKNMLETDILVPEDPDIVGAFGAALAAAE